MSEPVLAWHFLEEPGCTRSERGYPPPVQVEVGQTLTEARRPLVICHVGMHASLRALDALKYAPGPVVCRVRMSGEEAPSDGHTDKLCYSERTVLAMANAAVLLHEFGCWCAEQALLNERASGREPDPRSWEAIAAKRAWLSGTMSDGQLQAASAASWAAASAAVWKAASAAARAAAIAAAWAADWSACSAASWAAARAAAREVSSAAAIAVQNTELERRLFDLLGIEGNGDAR